MLVILYLAGRDLSKADDQWDSWRVIAENWCIVRAQLKLAKVGMISSRVIHILIKNRLLLLQSNWHVLNNSIWVVPLLFIWIKFGWNKIPIKKSHVKSLLCQGKGWISVALCCHGHRRQQWIFCVHFVPGISCLAFYFNWDLFNNFGCSLMCWASGTQKYGFS